MKSVLHVALIAPGLYSNEGLMKGFMEHEFTSYYLFDWQLQMYSYGKERMQHLLIEEAEKRKPDIIFMHIQSSDVIDLGTFKRLAEIAFTVNYTFDIRSIEQTEWLYELAGHIGLVCFSNNRDVEICRRRGYNNVMCLQSSCDMDLYKPREPDSREEIAIFIGNNTALTPLNFPRARERQQMVKMLVDNFPNKFFLFGLGWDSKFLMQPEEAAAYQNAAIGICQNQFDAPLYTSDRLWRVMASGCFCLTEKFEGIHTMFTRGLHLDYWETLDELKEMLGYYLSHPEQVKRIAFNGMNHVRMNHNWTVRIGELMTKVRSLRPEKKENPCLDAHRIDGIIPEPFDQKFDGRVCDCGKLRWTWEECGCVNKEYQLRATENV
jgi:hypothetical protein